MIENLILQLRAETLRLIEVVEQFNNDININPFDLESAQSNCETVAQELDLVKDLLDAIEANS